MTKQPLLIFILGITCPSLSVAVASDESLVQIEFIKKTDDLFSISAKLSNGLTVENIHLQKRRITHDWVLVFKSDEGLRVQFDNAPENAAMLDDESYSLLMHGILNRQIEAAPQIHISRVHSDLDFVESTWRLVTSAIKSEAKDLTGSVTLKDPRITHAMVQALEESPQLHVTCKALEMYGSRCHSEHLATIDPVAFRHQIVGLPWSALLDIDDAGLWECSWFSIRVREPAQ